MIEEYINIINKICQKAEVQFVTFDEHLFESINDMPIIPFTDDSHIINIHTNFVELNTITITWKSDGYIFSDTYCDADFNDGYLKYLTNEIGNYYFGEYWTEVVGVVFEWESLW